MFKACFTWEIIFFCVVFHFISENLCIIFPYHHKVESFARHYICSCWFLTYRLNMRLKRDWIESSEMSKRLFILFHAWNFSTQREIYLLKTSKFWKFFCFHILFFCKYKFNCEKYLIMLKIEFHWFSFKKMWKSS